MKQVLSALSVLFILVACQKEVEDEVPAADGCLLVRMVQGVGNSPLGDTTFEFTYNDTGRLEQITFKMDDFPAPYPFALSYDDHGNLIKVSTPLDAGSSLESSFTYDNQGRLYELHYQRFSDPSKIVYEYGSGNQPESATYYDYVSGQWEKGGTYKYTFSNGNVIKSEFSINGVYKWTNNYEYDADLANNMGVLPLVSFNSIPLGFYEEFLFFNKNLPKKLSWDGGTDYDIEYVLDGEKIVRSIGTYVYQGTSSQRDTRNFFFECK